MICFGFVFIFYLYFSSWVCMMCLMKCFYELSMSCVVLLLCSVQRVVAGATGFTRLCWSYLNLYDYFISVERKYHFLLRASCPAPKLIINMSMEAFS